jgi:hypothetical protein
MHAQEISIKKSKFLFLTVSIIFTGVPIYVLLANYHDILIFSQTHLTWAIIIMCLVLFLIIFFWYHYFDESSVITFDTKGITYRKKLTQWQDIQSFETVLFINPKSINTLRLILTQFDTDKKYSIDLFGLATDEEHIRECISNTSPIKIVDTGHSEK